MLALLVTLVAVLVATARAATSDITARKVPTLPQCGNLTIAWSEGEPPYTIHVSDMRDGHSVTLHSWTNHKVWTIRAPVGTPVYLLVSDARNTTSGGGPYDVVYSGRTDCLCNPPQKRGEEMEEMPRNVELGPKRADIMLPTILERDIWSFPADRRNTPSKKRAHRKRGSRRAAAKCLGL